MRIRFGGLVAAVLLILAMGAAAQNPAPLIVDGDGDGVSDEIDDCPYTPPNTPVDARGCPAQGDADGDGVPDSIDDCPYTPHGAKVDTHGCALDGDFDGVPDGIDQCPKTPLGERVDETGCMPGEKTGTPARSSAARPASSPIKPSRKPSSTTSKALDAAIEAALAEGAASSAGAPPIMRPAPVSRPQVVTVVPPIEVPTVGTPPPAVATQKAEPEPAVRPALVEPPVVAVAPHAEKPPESAPLASVQTASVPMLTPAAPAVAAIPVPVTPVASPKKEAVSSRFEVLGDIEFAKDSVELTDADFARLREIAKMAQARIAAAPGTHLLVAGAPTPSRKVGLARQRSALIRAFLMSNGLEPSDITYDAPKKLSLPPAKDNRSRLILLMPG